MSVDEPRLGPQGEYLQGLDHLRKVLMEIETELDNIMREFFRSEVKGDETGYAGYLKTCNDNLLACNNELRNSGVPLSVVDSELQIVSLLNGLRSCRSDTDLVNFVTEFWESLKYATEQMRALGSRFDSVVLKKLKSYCVSYAQDNAILPISAEYTQQVANYMEKLETSLKNTVSLLRSYDGGIKQTLFTNTRFTNAVLLQCDYKAFPILRLVPDVSEKFRSLCGVARRWIDSDETYVHDINRNLREMRHKTRQREQDLKTQRKKQKQITKNVTLSQSVFQKNKDKLRRIETELNSLESQIDQYRLEKTGKSEEKYQKESMVDFLNLGIKQTKRNYTLQLKRTRLMRQVKELEERLSQIESDLATMEKDAELKTHEKSQIEEKVAKSRKTYEEIKNEYDSFLVNVDELVEEVTGLSSQITQLEIIHTIKTSPERVDSFYGRPSSVKLAPSLKEKIRMRKRKIASQSIEGSSSHR